MLERLLGRKPKLEVDPAIALADLIKAKVREVEPGEAAVFVVRPSQSFDTYTKAGEIITPEDIVFSWQRKVTELPPRHGDPVIYTKWAGFDIVRAGQIPPRKVA
jgi:hypothetical protein